MMPCRIQRHAIPVAQAFCLSLICALGSAACYDAEEASTQTASQRSADGTPVATPQGTTTTPPGTDVPMPAVAWPGTALVPQNANGLCVDGRVAAGANVTLAPCNGSVLQRFKWEAGTVELAGERCLAVATAINAGVGTAVQLKACNGNDTTQLWTFQQGQIFPEIIGRTTPASLCLSAMDGNAVDGANLALASCTAAPTATPWGLRSYSDKNVVQGMRITSKVGPSICLDDYGAFNAAGTPLKQNTCNGNAAQGFNWSSNGLVANGVCVSVGTQPSAAGKYVVFNPCAAGDGNQSWMLERGQLRPVGGPAAGQCLDLEGKKGPIIAPVDVVPCVSGATPATEPELFWLLGVEERH
jgi:hypothetical protein